MQLSAAHTMGDPNNRRRHLIRKVIYHRSRSLEWSNQEAALLLFLLQSRLLSTKHSYYHRPVCVRLATVCPLLRAVCGPYTSDAKLVVAQKTIRTVPKRSLALLGLDVSLCLLFRIVTLTLGKPFACAATIVMAFSLGSGTLEQFGMG